MSQRIDIGHGVTISFTEYQGVRVGLIEEHPGPGGGRCSGSVWFRGMSQLSSVLRGSIEEPAHWCPGCQEMHVLPWKRGGWTFNGDVHAPTFTPSFKHDDRAGKVCHYTLTAGVLDFHPDCSHALRGKVPLPPLPAYPATGQR